MSQKLRLPVLILFAGVASYACVLVPLLQYLINDIVLRSTLLLDAMDLLSRHLEIVSSILLLEFVIFAIWRYSLGGAKRLLAVCASVIAFKYLAAVVSYSVAFGSLDLTGGLTSYLFSFLLELAIAAAVVFLCVQLISPQKDAHEARRAAAETLGREFSEKDPCYPFQNLFSYRNPVLLTTLISVLTVFALQTLAFVISYVSGAPMQASDIPVMLVYEVILILIPCAYSYFLACLFFRFCANRTRT